MAVYRPIKSRGIEPVSCGCRILLAPALKLSVEANASSSRSSWVAPSPSGSCVNPCPIMNSWKRFGPTGPPLMDQTLLIESLGHLSPRPGSKSDMTSSRIKRLSRGGCSYVQISLVSGVYECFASDLHAPIASQVCQHKIVILKRTTDSKQCAFNWLDLERGRGRIHVTDPIHRQAKGLPQRPARSL